METNSVAFFQSETYPDIPFKPMIAAWKISNPGNIGSLMRIADNVGADQVFILDDENPKRESAMKKTAGLSFKNVKLTFCSSLDFIKQIPSAYQLVAIETSTGSKNIYTTKLPAQVALLLGNEKHGLPAELLRECPLIVHIPMTGRCKSMNVSHALAVSLFEWQRQQLFG